MRKNSSAERQHRDQPNAWRAVRKFAGSVDQLATARKIDAVKPKTQKAAISKKSRLSKRTERRSARGPLSSLRIGMLVPL